MDDFFSSFDLDAIFSVDPSSELEPELAFVTEAIELEAAKTMMTVVKHQTVSQISNIPKIIEATDLLITSSILEDQKSILAQIWD